jgi:UDP-3-O-[3-hydroxymyristoyl] glucosamine N-acyltransferase
LATLDRCRAFRSRLPAESEARGPLATTRAGICLTTERLARDAPAGVSVLITPQPYQAFIAAGQALYPGAMRPSSLLEASRRVARRIRASLGAA